MTDILDEIAAATIARSQWTADLEQKVALLSGLLQECEERPAPTASGAPMPVGDLVGWRQIWSEDFDTDVAVGSFPGPYAPKVGVYPTNYYDTSQKFGRPQAQWGQYNAPRTVSVSESVCRIRMHTEGTRPLVCNLLPMLGAPQAPSPWTFQLYGRYEARARFTNPMPGYKVAWLLWPLSNNGLAQGEIDYPETNLSSLDSVGGFVHHIGASSGSDQYVMPRAPVNMREWHTYTIEWSPGLVRFLLDGAPVGAHSTRIPDAPMRWGLQCETTLTAAAPDPAVQGDIEIDWLAVWAHQPA